MNTIEAIFPCGRSDTVVGLFRVLPLIGHPDGMPAVVEDDESVVLLDPRSVVRSNGIRVYDGRAIGLTVAAHVAKLAMKAKWART